MHDNKYFNFTITFNKPILNDVKCCGVWCLKVLGKSVGGQNAKVLKKLWGEKVNELSDGVTESQIVQKIWKK